MTGLRSHGGRIDLATRRYPGVLTPWLDLSTGINPHAWAPASPPVIDLNALPSPAALEELEHAAAAMFGVPADRVAAVPGSEIGLRMLDRLGLPGPVRFAAPSYATHAAVFADASSVTRGAIDTVREGTLLLANPNNPDGHIDAPATLTAVARHGGTLVVDEAFADALPETSIIPHSTFDDDPGGRIVVLRSFGKFFGLAGLRLGFVIAPPPQIAALRRLLGDWPISAHAITYGTQAYRDSDWIDRTRIQLVKTATRLDNLLARHGLMARGACPLFRLIETDDAAMLFDRLANAGILTRAFDYAPTWLRIGLPGDEGGFDRLDQALVDD